VSPDTVLQEVARHDGRHVDCYGRCPLCKARDVLIDAFAKVNGWKRTFYYSCYPEDLGRAKPPSHRWTINVHDRRLFDHSLWFKAGRRYVAAIGQPYPEAIHGIEEERARLLTRGFVLHVPPDPRASIHYPGATVFLVVTLPGVEVRWLPEQDGRLAASWKARLHKSESA
jgi:hypothetical protein